MRDRPITSDGRAEQAMQIASYASVVVAFVLIFAKTYAWLATGSVAILSSLIDSFLDALASIVTFVAVRHSLQPADREHRFGHGKVEALAALAQSAFIVGSAVLLLFEAGARALAPRPHHGERDRHLDHAVLYRPHVRARYSSEMGDPEVTIRRDQRRFPALQRGLVDERGSYCRHHHRFRNRMDARGPALWSRNRDLHHLERLPYRAKLFRYADGSGIAR